MGVCRILGEETAKMGRKKGPGTEALGLRALEIGWWSYRPRICDCFYCARGRGNHLQGTGGAASGSLFARMGFLESPVPEAGPGAPVIYCSWRSTPSVTQPPPKQRRLASVSYPFSTRDLISEYAASMSRVKATAFVKAPGLSLTWRINFPAPCSRRAGSGNAAP